MADKIKDRRMTSGIGNTTTTRGFTLDRFEQEVASEIGLGSDRKRVTGRQQGTTSGGTTTSSTAPGSAKKTSQPDSERP